MTHGEETLPMQPGTIGLGRMGASVGRKPHELDAGTTPLRQPERRRDQPRSALRFEFGGRLEIEAETRPSRTAMSEE